MPYFFDWTPPSDGDGGHHPLPVVVMERRERESFYRVIWNVKCILVESSK